MMHLISSSEAFQIKSLESSYCFTRQSIELVLLLHDRHVDTYGSLTFCVVLDGYSCSAVLSLYGLLDPC